MLRRRGGEAASAHRGRLRLEVVAPLLLVVLGAAAYWGTLDVPFIFDDDNAIVDNPHIRSLLPLSRSLTAPDESTVAGRPVVSFTLALNHAVSGLKPWSYHLFNIAIHVLASVALFGVVRRTLAGPRLGSAAGGPGAGWALGAAAVWLVHPLQTESVTYVSTRTESLMGLFYLVAFYALIRSASSPRPAVWGAVCVAATALAMGTKEVAVTIPVVLLAFDAVFLADGWKDALTRRRWLYLGLAATWLVLAGLMVGGPRSETVGLSFPEMRPLDYLRTQAGVILTYVRLAAWPHPLALDYYDWPVVRELTPGAALAMLVLAGLLAASLWLLWKRSWAGFVGFAFFAILAPTSSVVPIVSEVAAERRMYLPLAPLVVLALAGVWWALGRLDSGRRRPAFAVVVTLIALVLVGVTLARNRVYGSEIGIWEDTVAKRPGNTRAVENLGTALARAGRHHEAAEQFRRSLRLNASSALALEGLGGSLLQLGQREEGVAQIRQALQVDPSATRALENLGLIQLEEGRVDEAVRLLRRAAELQPEDGVSRVNLAKALLASGDLDGAEAALTEAVRLAPDNAVAHARLATLLAERGRPDVAAPHLERALELDPRDPSTRLAAGQIALRRGDVDRALGHYRSALEAAPENREAALGLAACLHRSGRATEAAGLLDRIVLEAPEAGELIRLAEVAGQGLDPVTGVGLLRAGVHARPADPDLRFALGRTLAGSGQAVEAVRHLREALRLRPGWGDVGNSLALLLATAEETDVREPGEAVRLARELVAASGGRHPVLLGTLGVALASDGRRREAEETLSRAVTLARSAQQEAVARHLDRYLEMVGQGWPPPPSR